MTREPAIKLFELEGYMKYLLHNDEPTLDDKLSREELVMQIANTAAKCAPPQVLGIHGDWGAGKTNMLEQVNYK
jgi:predicted KAP-like P-loop ATPase